MNDIINSILSRRSIRKYTNEPISEEVIKNLLKVAMSAPSAVNQQPWHYIVVKDRGILDKLASISFGFNMLKEAPLAIVVCGEPAVTKIEDFWPQDCAASTENILLAAHAYNLGAVWLGVYPNKDFITKISTYLNIPQNIIPFSIISVGHPKETIPPSNRYNEVKIRYNKWQ